MNKEGDGFWLSCQKEYPCLIGLSEKEFSEMIPLDLRVNISKLSVDECVDMYLEVLKGGRWLTSQELKEQRWLQYQATLAGIDIETLKKLVIKNSK